MPLSCHIICTYICPPSGSLFSVQSIFPPPFPRSFLASVPVAHGENSLISLKPLAYAVDSSSASCFKFHLKLFWCRPSATPKLLGLNFQLVIISNLHDKCCGERIISSRVCTLPRPGSRGERKGGKKGD